MMTPNVLRAVKAKRIWDLRDNLIDDRADGFVEPREAAEQIELLYNLAEAVETGEDDEYSRAAIARYPFDLVARVPASDWLRVSVS